MLLRGRKRAGSVAESSSISTVNPIYLLLFIFGLLLISLILFPDLISGLGDEVM